MLESCSRRHETLTTSTTGATYLVNRNNAGMGKRKGVTFRDRHGGNSTNDSDDRGVSRHHSKHSALIRASLRHLAVSSADGSNGLTAAATGSMGNSVGPGLRDRLSGALQAAADARGARSGSGHVDRETVRRAMVACGAPLESKLLWDLERLFDDRGTGEINVKVRNEWWWARKMKRRVSSNCEGRHSIRASVRLR